MWRRQEMCDVQRPPAGNSVHWWSVRHTVVGKTFKQNRFRGKPNEKNGIWGKTKEDFDRHFRRWSFIFPATASTSPPLPLQQCTVCPTAEKKGRLDERRGRERRNKERLSCRRLCVCVVRWRVSRHQREIQQTFKGTAQWGVLARRWFGQLAYLLTQPRLTVRRKATEASTATSKTQTGRPAAGKSHSRVYRTFRIWQVWILTTSPPAGPDTVVALRHPVWRCCPTSR